MFSQAHRNKISCLFNTTSLLLLNLKERISWRPSPPWRHHREWKVKTFQHLCSRAFSSCKQKLSSHEDRVFLCVSVCIWVCERCQEDLYTAAGLPPSDQDHPDFNTQSRGRGAATHTHTQSHIMQMLQWSSSHSDTHFIWPKQTAYDECCTAALHNLCAESDISKVFVNASWSCLYVQCQNTLDENFRRK